MTKTIGKLSALMIAVIALFTFSVPANAAGTYAHDPMANPKAAADIIVDPNAVYGYAPNPDSAPSPNTIGATRLLWRK